MRRLLTLSHRGTRRAAFLPPVAAALAAAACAGPTDPGQRVILGVTRLDAPATFAAGEAFDVTLTVATGGCTRFTGIEAARAPGRLSLTAVGRERAGASGRARA